MKTIVYLLKKLEEMGITDFFGLPGDYNFNIVSQIEKNPNLNWIGCTNELNAGYASDGYAREKGFGALVTTYGVGELSAINAIAGSFAENVPVIHIVGTPPLDAFKSEKILHHSFQGADSKVYMKMHEAVTSASAFLNKDGAKLEIDRVLKTFYKERKPVYLAIPSDIAVMEISDREIDYDWVSDSENLETAVKLISDKINKAFKPAILADSLINRFGAKKEFDTFLEQASVPAVNFLTGAGIIDANYKNFAGNFLSTYGNLTANSLMKETDCLISVGVINGDLNSYGAKLPYKINSHIAIYGTYSYIDGIKYDNIKMSDVLIGVSKNLRNKKSAIKVEDIGYESMPPAREALSSNYIYSRLQSFIKDGDIIIAETGLVSHGIFKMKLPSNTKIHSQLIWCSIGWATASALGVCIANPNARVVLVTGDGAHQISAMEIGNMHRYGVTPLILVINNDGYGIERLLFGNEKAKFNDIMQMDYSKFVRSFKGEVWSTCVNTEDDFDKALRVTQIMDKLCYIEAVTNKSDIPDTANCLFYLNDSEKFVSKSEQSDEQLSVSGINNNYETSVHASIKEFEG